MSNINTGGASARAGLQFAKQPAFLMALANSTSEFAPLFRAPPPIVQQRQAQSQLLSQQPSRTVINPVVYPTSFYPYESKQPANAPVTVATIVNAPSAAPSRRPRAPRPPRARRPGLYNVNNNNATAARNQSIENLRELVLGGLQFRGDEIADETGTAYVNRVEAFMNSVTRAVQNALDAAQQQQLAANFNFYSPNTFGGGGGGGYY